MKTRLSGKSAAPGPGRKRSVSAICCPTSTRLITYKSVADKAETQVNFKSHLILRNFSGEDFSNAKVLLDYGESFEEGIRHEETKQLLFLKAGTVPIEKVWQWDSQSQIWDPEEVDQNVGIPVHYRITNTKESNLGQNALWNGKMRVFQLDGYGSTILLGEDIVELTPVGEDMEVYIGDSRDLVVTQRKMVDRQTNIRRNTSGRVVLYDNEEQVTAKIENFKDTDAKLKMVQHIPGEWDMHSCNFEYKKENANTIEFELDVPAQGEVELVMHYFRRNIRN
jgi:hypothetical protein